MEVSNSVELKSPEDGSPKAAELKESDRNLFGEKRHIGPKIEEKILQIFSDRQDPYENKGWISKEEGVGDSFQSEFEKESVHDNSLDKKNDSVVAEENNSAHLKNGLGKIIKKTISFKLVDRKDKEKKKSPIGRLQKKGISPQRQNTSQNTHIKKDNSGSPKSFSKTKNSRGKSEIQESEVESFGNASLSKYMRARPTICGGGVFKRRNRLAHLYSEDSTLKGLLFKQKLDKFMRNLRSHSGRNDKSKLTIEKLKIINDQGGYSSELNSQFIKTNDLKKNWMKAHQSKNGRQDKFSEMKKSTVKLLHLVEEYICVIKFWAQYFYAYLDEKVPVLKHFGNFKFFWETLMLLLTVWNLISLSLTISFGISLQEGISLHIPFLNNEAASFWFHLTCFMFYTLDILLKFNMGIYKNGEPIYDRKKIAINYLASSFLFDVLGTLPFWLDIFNYDDYSDERTHYLIFLRIYPLRIFFRNINEAFLNFEGKFESVYQLLRLLLTLLLVFHIFACVWHYQALDAKYESSWILKQNLENSPWAERYVRSLYFIIVTMLTVGYGDITPSNSKEYLIAMACMFTGSVLVGYSINCIGAILKRKNKVDIQYRNKMQLVNSYLNKNKVDESLKLRLRKYLEYIWKTEKSASEKECEELLKELPNSLRDELLTQTRFWALQSIFGNRFKRETINKLVRTLTLFQFSKEEWIFKEGDLDSSLYVIVKGSIEMILNSQRGTEEKLMNVGTKKAGELIGVESFFLDGSKQISARANSICSVLKLSRTKFLDIVKDSSEDYEQFCFMRDKMLLYSDMSVIGRKCPSCGEISHSVRNCPFLTYKPFKDVIIKRHLFSLPQNRHHYKRSKINKVGKFKNALFDNCFVRNSVRDYQTEKLQEETKEKYTSFFQTLSLFHSVNELGFAAQSEENIGNIQIPSKDDLFNIEQNMNNLQNNEPFKINLQPRTEQLPEIKHHAFFLESQEKNVKSPCFQRDISSSSDQEFEESNPLPPSSKKREEKQEGFNSKPLLKIPKNTRLSIPSEESKHSFEVEKQEDSDTKTLKSLKNSQKSKFALFMEGETKEDLDQRHLKNVKASLRPKIGLSLTNIEIENKDESDLKSLKSAKSLLQQTSNFGQPLFHPDFDAGCSFSMYFPESNKERVLAKIKKKIRNR